MSRIKRKLEFYIDILKWARNYSPSEASKHKCILCDYLHLYHQKGLTKEEYAEFEMESCSEEFRNAFLGLNEQRFYLDYLNPKKFYILARNKYISHKILENRDIRKAELYCFYEPQGKAESNEIAYTLAGVLRILKAKNVSSCVIKATESSHGDQVVVVKSIDFKENDAILHLFNGQDKNLTDVLAQQPLVFEEIIKQTDQIAAINPDSVNTVRFMTTLYPDGEARIVATFMKIGRAGKCVDNAGTGGNVDACIETSTGVLQYAIRYDGMHNYHDIDTHPDSGNPINGVVIDNWEQIKSEVLRFQQAFPYVKAAGWDIAITDEGPVVIEVNDMWDRTGQAFIRRGWREEIRDCYLAWQRTGQKFYMGRYNNMLSTEKLEKIAQKEFKKLS